MKNRTHMLLAMIGSLLLYACNEDAITTHREVSLDCLYSNYEAINSLIDTTTVGEEDGTYPLENARSLQAALDEVEVGISKGLAELYTLQYEADNYCVAAEKAIAEYENSLQLSLDPGTPAELIVYGIDGKGRIEFGADPAFAGDDAFTVEAWLKYNPGFFEHAIGNFISTFDGSAQPHEGWMINFLGDNLRATIGMGPQHSRVLEFGKLYPQNFGEWNHIAMVYDQNLTEGQLKVYVNGQEFFSKTNDIVNNSGELQLYQPNTINFNMWAFQEPTDLARCMTGYIKKFRFWNDAKSESDLNILMNSDVTGTETELECAWDFTEVATDDSNIPDKTGNHTATIVGSYKWEPIDN